MTKVFSDWWGRTKVYAVDDLNLKVNYNEVFGLLGPNGSGKTTTIKTLLGLLHPTKGRAFCLGADATNSKISARIGFLPEESYLYRYLNARETLDFYGRLFGLDRQVRKMRIEALLDMVGLKAVANRPVGTFSKGMARRIGLAQALINDPDLLILDEPTTGLDPIGTRQIKDLILKLAERGKTILLCSHLLADVEDVCNRIAILYGGKIQAKGHVKELLEQSDKRLITTDAISDDAVEKIVQIARGENAECTVTSPMEKLESFFIKTVKAAQQQATPTSGAVSTTKIGQFLAGGAAESILDKLVSETPAEAPVAPVTTEQVTPDKESEPDSELLGALTEASDSGSTVRPTPDAAETEPPEPEADQADQPDTSILDELTGRAKPETEKPKRVGEDSAGGSNDG